MSTATLAEILVAATATLAASDSARLDAELLLCHVISRSRTYLYSWPDATLSDAQFQAFQQLLARREAGEPVAHLTGTRAFWNLDLEVDASTLIPRPDTEMLVETALANAKLAHSKPAPLTLLDLGTGTGAIALALAGERPAWEVVAVDASADAVALATRNAELHQLTNVRIVQSDWYRAFDGQRFDMIVSNPPYMDTTDPHLAQGDVRFEPRSALVADDQGLADLRHIVTEARHHLLPGGRLLVEHGYDQGPAVQALFEAAGFSAVSRVLDYAGNERVTHGVWNDE